MEIVGLAVIALMIVFLVGNHALKVPSAWIADIGVMIFFLLGPLIGGVLMAFGFVACRLADWPIEFAALGAAPPLLLIIYLTWTTK